MERLLTIHSGDVTIEDGRFEDAPPARWRCTAAPPSPGTSFVGNGADVYGGALLVTGGKTLLAHSTLTKNTAKQGGGVCVLGGDLVLFNRTLLEENSASEGTATFLNASVLGRASLRRPATSSQRRATLPVPTRRSAFAPWGDELSTHAMQKLLPSAERNDSAGTPFPVGVRCRPAEQRRRVGADGRELRGPCEPGYKCSAGGAEMCSVGHWCLKGQETACAKGSWNDRRGSSRLEDCAACPPLRTTEGEGSASLSDCVCEPSTFACPEACVRRQNGSAVADCDCSGVDSTALGGDFTCLPCVIGTTCPNPGTTLETLSIDEGSWRIDAIGRRPPTPTSPPRAAWAPPPRTRRARLRSQLHRRLLP